MSRSPWLTVLPLLVLPGLAFADPAPSAKPGLRRAWSIQAVVAQPGAGLPLELGAVGALRLSRGRVELSAGLGAATAAAGGTSGHIRFESTTSYELGRIYAGVGFGAGTLAMETPGRGRGKWAGSAMALHVQIGTRLDLGGDRKFLVEARLGHSFPIGSIIPNDPIPDGAAHAELTVAAGVAF